MFDCCVTPGPKWTSMASFQLVHQPQTYASTPKLANWSLAPYIRVVLFVLPANLAPSTVERRMGGPAMSVGRSQAPQDRGGGVDAARDHRRRVAEEA